MKEGRKGFLSQILRRGTGSIEQENSQDGKRGGVEGESCQQVTENLLPVRKEPSPEITVYSNKRISSREEQWQQHRLLERSFLLPSPEVPWPDQDPTIHRFLSRILKR